MFPKYITAVFVCMFSKKVAAVHAVQLIMIGIAAIFDPKWQTKAKTHITAHEEATPFVWQHQVEKNREESKWMHV